MSDDRSGQNAGNDIALAASSALPGNNPAEAAIVSSLIQSGGGGMPSGGAEHNPIVFGPQGTQPRPPVQYQPPQGAFSIPQGHFNTVGDRKRAERQSLFSGIAATVKSGTDYIQAKKTRALEMDIERLMSAYEGMNEAKANGNEEAYKKNQEIINDITKDPKKAKQIAKAFNIDLLGGGKNKAENQALYSAYKSYQEKQQKGESGLNPGAQRIISGMPQRAQMNPADIVKAQMVKDKLIPDANKQLEEQTKILEEAGKNSRAAATATNYKERTTAIEETAKGVAKLGQAKLDEWAKAEGARTKMMGDIAEVHARASLAIAQEATHRAVTVEDKRVEALEKVASLKENDTKAFRLLNTQAQDIAKRRTEAVKEQASLLKTINDQPGMFSFLNPGKDKTGLDAQKLAEVKIRLSQVQSNMRALDAEDKVLQGNIALAMKMGSITIPKDEAGTSSDNPIKDEETPAVSQQPDDKSPDIDDSN